MDLFNANQRTNTALGKKEARKTSIKEAEEIERQKCEQISVNFKSLDILS